MAKENSLISVAKQLHSKNFENCKGYNSEAISFPKLISRKIWLVIYVCRYIVHSVETSEFFCHTGFTWNLFRDSRSSRNCHFGIFEVLNLDFNDFLHFQRAEIFPKTKFRASGTAKMAVFEIQKSMKLISRKFWVAQKNMYWNFYSVYSLPVRFYVKSTLENCHFLWL